ncbi:hypothetical protein IW146_009035 [Coemansia sp. RSA 922]|nr:hypothetical protein IW146_009035 [Coemansia sp. RSA 922]
MLVSIIGTILLLARAGSGQTYILGVTDSTGKNGYNHEPMFSHLLRPDIPVMDMYSTHMTCRTLDMNDKVKPFVVAAGEVVPLTYEKKDVSPISGQPIKGPCSFYLSNTTAKGKGAVWFPIEKTGSDGTLWCSELIKKNGYTHGVKIPKDIPAGTYYLRSEIIDLSAYLDNKYEDFTREPQFYIDCLAITVTGSGKVAPKGSKIPGIYNNAESKFLINVDSATDSKKFTIPGPAIDPLLITAP